jgi:hypothetical protein
LIAPKTFFPGTSAAVKTASTPGISLAIAVFIFFILACAYLDQTILPKSISSSDKSSINFSLPVTFSKALFIGSGAPI